MHINDLVAQHRVVIGASIEVVARIRADDLSRPTPCVEWTLAELLAHMTAQHRGFAAAARGTGGDLAAWAVHPVGSSPVADYTDAAVDLLAAFASPAAEFELPEFQPVSRFPAVQAVGFHLIDYVVHGWDVARSLGLDYQLPPDVAEPALRIALLVPDGDNRLASDSPFAPALAAGDDVDPLDRILTALGRSPSWPKS